MINFYEKYRKYLLLALGILLLLRSIYRLFKGTITIANATPEGFDKDYVMGVWAGKIVLLLVGLVLLILGIRNFLRVQNLRNSN